MIYSTGFAVLLTLVALAGITTGLVAACWPGLYTPDTSRVDPVEASGDWHWPDPWTDDLDDEAGAAPETPARVTPGS